MNLNEEIGKILQRQGACNCGGSYDEECKYQDAHKHYFWEEEVAALLQLFEKMEEAALDKFIAYFKAKGIYTLSGSDLENACEDLKNQVLSSTTENRGGGDKHE